MKIIYACSHWMGFPALELLMSRQILSGLVIPQRDNDSVHLLRQLAERNDIPLYTARSRRHLAELGQWHPLLDADALFVNSFPWRIAESVLSVPRLGSFNFHPGDVPNYRGIEPVFWTIANGCTETVITAMQMDGGLDTGKILFKQPVPMLPHDTYGMLLNRLATFGRTAVETMLTRLDGMATSPAGTMQPDGEFPLQKKPVETDLLIRWKHQTAAQITNLIRAANPVFDGASVVLRNVPFKILEATAVSAATLPNAMPGTVLAVDDTSGLTVACRDGALKIDIIRTQEGVFTGKRFAAMYGIRRGELFSS